MRSSAIPVALLALLLAAILHEPQRITHDCAYLLEGARTLLDGGTLYVDFVDSNPPMIFYLNLIPVVIARALGVLPILPFSLFVFTLVAGSTLAMRALARRLPGVGPGDADLLTVGWIAGSLLAWQNGDYGQRDHLFVLLYAPFLVLRAVRFEGGAVPRGWALTAGVVAAVGVSLKPWFAVVAVAPELYWLATRRTARPWLAPEVGAVAATALAYAAHFLWLPQEARVELFGRLVPLHLLVYDVYRGPLDVVFRRSFPFFLGKVPVAALAGLAVFVPFALGRGAREGMARLGQPFAVVTAAAFAVYLYQRTGWRYHALPTFMVALCALATAIPPGWLRASGRFGAWGLPALVLVVSVSGIGRLASAGVAAPPATPFSQVVEQYSEAGDSVAFVATSLPPAYPALLQLDRRLANRYPCNLPIPFSLGLEAIDPDAARAEKSRYLRELAEDIERKAPRLVFVDSDGFSQGCPPGFSLWEWLEEAGFFEDALSDYRRLPMIPGHAVFIRDD